MKRCHSTGNIKWFSWKWPEEPEKSSKARTNEQKDQSQNWGPGFSRYTWWKSDMTSKACPGSEARSHEVSSSVPCYDCNIMSTPDLWTNSGLNLPLSHHVTNTFFHGLRIGVPTCMLASVWILTNPLVTHSHYSINSGLTLAPSRISVHCTCTPLPSKIGTPRSRGGTTHKLKPNPIRHQNSTSLCHSV